MAKEEGRKFLRDRNSSAPVHTSTNRLVPLVMSEFGMMGAHFVAHLSEMADHLVSQVRGLPMMIGPFAVSKQHARNITNDRWHARLVWSHQRANASHILATWSACQLLASTESNFLVG